MARIRTIKPDFWDDEKLALQCSRDARLTYIGLWNFSDDYAVVKGNPSWLKNQIYPYENLNLSIFKKWLQELKQGKFIIPFSVNSESYYFIRNFSKHQKINRPSETRNPEPPKNIHELLNESSLSTHGCISSSKGGEGRGVGKEIYAHFEKFWKPYPKKKSKGDAEKAFIKLNPSEQLLETIISKIEQAKTSEEWQKEGGKYIPYPATWLNAKGWEDEYSVDLSIKQEKPHVANPDERLSDEDRLSPKEREELKGFVKGIGKGDKKKTLKEIQEEIKEIEIKTNPSEQELQRKRLLDEQRKMLGG